MPLSIPLVPWIGVILIVLGIARISTLNQDERSLEDQEALYRRWLDENYKGEYKLVMIAGQGSGECPPPVDLGDRRRRPLRNGRVAIAGPPVRGGTPARRHVDLQR
jgi:hypothetical protein